MQRWNFTSFHVQRDFDVGCVKSSPWRKQSHFSWQKLCMFYRVTCSFRVFLGGNYIHCWNISSCCCFDSPACIQFSCQLSRLIWTSSPALHITLEIPVQLQSLSLIKKHSICDLPLFFHRDSLVLWWLWPPFGDYRSVDYFLRFFLCCLADFLVSKAVWVWKINLLISEYFILIYQSIDYFLFYFHATCSSTCQWVMMPFWK